MRAKSSKQRCPALYNFDVTFLWRHKAVRLRRKKIGIFLHKQPLVTWGFARSRSPTLKVCSHLVRIVN